jgi:hypothetical protein
MLVKTRIQTLYSAYIQAEIELANMPSQRRKKALKHHYLRQLDNNEIKK